MDHIRTALILAFCVPLIGAVATGCNTGTEEPAAPKTDATVETVVPDDIDPSGFPELPAGAKPEVPDTYPADLPLYPGAVPVQRSGESSADGDMAAVQLLTEDPPEKAFGFYRDELESKGWDVNEREASEDEDGKSSIAVTKEGCKAIFMFVPSESGSGTEIFSISACSDES